MKKDKIEKSIFKAIDEVNQQLLDQQAIEKKYETALTGNATKVGSMSLISLLLAVEEEIENTFNINLNLLGEENLSKQNDPFESIETLINYVSHLLTQQGIDS